MKFLSPRLRGGLCGALFALFTATSCSGTAVSQTAPADPLAGLWGAEVRFGVPAQGELTLDGRGGVWRALLAGYQVTVQAKDGNLRFKLPGDAGEFRGHLDAAANVIRGQWIQPKGDILNQQYASPIELQSISSSVWPPPEPFPIFSRSKPCEMDPSDFFPKMGECLKYRENPAFFAYFRNNGAEFLCS